MSFSNTAMSSTSFLTMDYNPVPNYSHLPENINSSLEFYLSDYAVLDHGFGHDPSPPQTIVASEQFAGCPNEYSAAASSRTTGIACKTRMKKNKMEVTTRVAFRTKSELEVMDDGFKWRKYGKKSVKNSPNPRNYYKCSSGGCDVKKRVERDREDSSYVITTYEGVHNHESPGAAYYMNMHPATVPPPAAAANANANANACWPLQTSSPRSSSSS